VPITAAILLPGALFWRGRRQSGTMVWTLPAIALVALILLYPMFDLLRLSVTDSTVAAARYSYTTASYRDVLSDAAFYGMATVTVVFVAASVALQLTLGFALAWLIDAGRRRGAPATLIARVPIVSAWVIPGVLAG